MNRDEFLAKLEDIFQYEDSKKLTFDTKLDDLEEWDSLSIISVVAFLDSEFNKQVTVNDLQVAQTVEDIAVMAGI